MGVRRGERTETYVYRGVTGLRCFGACQGLGKISVGGVEGSYFADETPKGVGGSNPPSLLSLVPPKFLVRGVGSDFISRC